MRIRAERRKGSKAGKVSKVVNDFTDLKDFTNLKDLIILKPPYGHAPQRKGATGMAAPFYHREIACI